MHVVAFSNPSSRGWRWRLVNYAGDIVEESHETFSSIAIAIEDGTRRKDALNIVDMSRPPSPFRRTSQFRDR